ncbi:mucin-5AC isoform X2 [Bicyclus anynana]|uniref:Mucin-5AC isoform X2 n=1 Tax=Bicyclus anynana TaxID=110368 RepID=A0A6J1P3J6_BICAN|nr:mucin-5AC isoform X2 [Bicyclus anynana]
MYKTVRHGENSLQYTILPQTEEVLSNSGLKGKGRDYSPSIHVRRANRKFALKFVLFIVVGVIVSIGFASIPIYSVLYARRSQHNQHELMTSAPLPATGQEIIKSRKSELKKIVSEESSTSKTSLETSVAPTTTTTTTTFIPSTGNSDKATTPPWNMPALRSWKFSSSSTTIQPIPTEDSEEVPQVGTSRSVRLLDHYMAISMKPWEKDTIIRATVTPEPTTIRNIFRYHSRAFNPTEKPITSVPKLFEDVLITTKATTTQTPMTTEVVQTSANSKLQDLKDAILSVDDDDEFKESLEVDEVFSLPPLKPDSAAPGTDSDEVTVSKATDGNWYGARWPFVDASSYFQWTGYSPGDNLLLPLLVAAMSSIALVFLLALAVRRRKRSTTASAQIGLTADLQADDNTNLLTAENPEETEE